MGLEGFLALVQQERGCSNSVAGLGSATGLSIIVQYEIEHIVHNDLFKQDNAKSFNLNFPHLQNPARKVLDTVPLRGPPDSEGPGRVRRTGGSAHALCGGAPVAALRYPGWTKNLQEGAVVELREQQGCVRALHACTQFC